MRVLAFADEAPPADAAELVARNAADAVVTLGDLRPGWIASLETLDLPRLGVHGNHDAPHSLAAVGVRDLHLARAEVAGWSFAGFEGCVRYRDGPHQYTQEEAERLARRLPGADVLLCHCPPESVNDEPDDPAHLCFTALRNWAERAPARARELTAGLRVGHVVEPLVPELLEEVAQAAEPLGAGAVEPPRPVAALAEQLGLAQHPQVLRYGGAGDVAEPCGDLSSDPCCVAGERRTSPLRASASSTLLRGVASRVTPSSHEYRGLGKGGGVTKGGGA